MRQIRVHRKAHHRQGYYRNGKYVKPAHVDEATFMTKDKGKKGRTPKKNRWFEANKHTLGDYSVDASASERHKEIRKADKKIGTVKVHHHLLGLANVTTDRKAEKVFKKDLKWVDKNLLNDEEGRRLTRIARKARLKLGKNPHGPG